MLRWLYFQVIFAQCCTNLAVFGVQKEGVIKRSCVINNWTQFCKNRFMSYRLAKTKVFTLLDKVFRLINLIDGVDHVFRNQ